MKKYCTAFAFIICFAAFSCSQRNNFIVFQPVFHGKSIQLEEKIILDDSNWVSFSTLKFYVSSLVLEGASSSFKDSVYCHLMDAEIPESFIIPIPTSDFHALSFSIGIDSSMNVAGILEGDLDPIKGMYWAWNSGYINFKLEGKSSLSTEKNKSFEFHIGGYLYPYSTIRPVKLPIHSTDSMVVQVDIDKFFHEFPLNKTASVMVPGKLATNISDVLPLLFNCPEDEK